MEAFHVGGRETQGQLDRGPGRGGLHRDELGMGLAGGPSPIRPECERENTESDEHGGDHSRCEG